MATTTTMGRTLAAAAVVVMLTISQTANGYDCDARNLGAALKSLNENICRELDVERFPLTGEAMKQFATAIMSNEMIRQLEFQNTDIAFEDLLVLVPALQQRKATLFSLEFKGNSFGDAGAVLLAEAFGSPTFQSIRKLDLSRNVIGDKGASALAAACQTTHIQELDLSNNVIGNEGALSFAHVLPKSYLHELELNNNNILADGAIALAEGARASPILRELDLLGNSIGPSGFEELQTLKQDAEAHGRRIKLKFSRQGAVPRGADSPVNPNPPDGHVPRPHAPPKLNRRPVASNWTEKEVHNWLSTVADGKLKQYADAFADNAVDGETLLDLTQSDLAHIVDNKLLLRRLFTEIQRLRKFDEL